MRKTKLHQAEGSTCVGIFSPAVVYSRYLKKICKWDSSTTVWNGERACYVGCSVSGQQVSCHAHRAVGNWFAAHWAMQETKLGPDWSVAQVSGSGSWAYSCIALPWLDFSSGLVCGDSLVRGHNSCFIFITAYAKLAFLSAWSRKETSFLIGFSRLLSSFPWRFTCTNTTGRDADAAGEGAGCCRQIFLAQCSYSGLFSEKKSWQAGW